LNVREILGMFVTLVTLNHIVGIAQMRT
jgi:hypothetical protein